MAAPRPLSAVWIKLLLGAGSMLAVALLVQTVLNYRFVSTNLIRQQARRTAEDAVRDVERGVRLSHPLDAEAFRAVLEDIRGDAPDRIASVVALQSDGIVFAGAGRNTPVSGSGERQRFLGERDAPLEADNHAGREVLVGIFPCRCTLPTQSSGKGDRPGRLLLEVAIYADALTTSFARLRRNAAISAAAALALLVSVASIAVRFGSYVRGKQLEAQMDVARQVQTDLLPSSDSLPSDIDVAAHCAPAWQVGGDFYDVVRLPNGRVSFVLGDVSGHGVSAALLMSLIHGAMSSPPWGIEEGDPDRGARRLNDLLLAKSSGERYASLFWCSYDPASGTLRYLNAGHLPPFWVRNTPDGSRRIDRLALGGPVVGVLTSAIHHTTVEQTAEGDLLVLFSDGIVEAVNRRDEPFGEDGLAAVVQEHTSEPARAICDAILSAVGAFTGAKPPLDDQTLLVVRLWRTTAERAHRAPS